MPLRLVVRNGPSAGRTIDPQASTVIGRTGCDVEIEDPQISRRHASLVATAQGVYIADLGSSNGTFVNGTRITASTWLRSGDVVVLGATQIAVEVDAAATVAYAAPAPPPSTVPLVASPPAAVAAPAIPAPTGVLAAPVPGQRRAATRMPLATVLSFGTVIVTAVALILYFALR